MGYVEFCKYDPYSQSSKRWQVLRTSTLLALVHNFSKRPIATWESAWKDTSTAAMRSLNKASHGVKKGLSINVDGAVALIKCC